jgi:ribonuclease E
MVLPSPTATCVLRRLVECLGRDRTRHQVSEVTSLGLVQMTRKKIGTGLAEAFTEECAECGGRGYHRSSEPVDSQAPADGGERSGHSKGRSNRSRSGSKHSGRSSKNAD